MEPYYTNGQATVFHGDCRTVLAGMAAGSFDCCVTDPPYDLVEPRSGGDGPGRATGVAWIARTDDLKPKRRGGFMGKSWDGTGVAFDPETWRAVYRVLRPGAPLLAFGGTRTWHRLACAIEDAGFVIFDTLMWLHGQGFPKHKSLLKPAWEPIVVAKRPGPGGLRTEAGRIAADVSTVVTHRADIGYMGGLKAAGTGYTTGSENGRWPSNVCLSHVPPDEHGAGGCVEVGVRRVKGQNGTRAGSQSTGIIRQAPRGTGEVVGYADPDGYETVPAYRCVAECPIAMLDAQAGESTSPDRPVRQGGYHGGGFDVGKSEGRPRQSFGIGYGDTGGASRFFYCSKADKSERLSAADGTRHPTQKPEDLMRWLVRLACPPGGRLLDPFCGSGTTIKAAIGTAAEAVGVDAELAYCEIAATRTSQPALVLTTY